MPGRRVGDVVPRTRCHTVTDARCAGGGKGEPHPERVRHRTPGGIPRWRRQRVRQIVAPDTDSPASCAPTHLIALIGVLLLSACASGGGSSDTSTAGDEPGNGEPAGLRRTGCPAVTSPTTGNSSRLGYVII